jgi:hypothetical protein
VHQRFGDESAAVRTEVAGGIGQVVWFHPRSLPASAARTADTNSRISVLGLMCRSVSTPLMP